MAVIVILPSLIIIGQGTIKVCTIEAIPAVITALQSVAVFIKEVDNTSHAAGV